MDSVGQDQVVRMICFCSRMFKASAGKAQRLRVTCSWRLGLGII